MGKGMMKKRMKRKWRKMLAAGLAAALAAGALAGCGTRATPENLLRDMKKNSESVESALINLKMSADMSDSTYDVSLDIDMDMEAVTDPEAAHAKGSIGVSMTGMDLSSEMESYSVLEGDEYVVYSMLDDAWTKETEDAGELAGDVKKMSESMESQADRFELSEDLVDVNGQECFELSGELNADFILEMADSGMLEPLSEYGLDEEMLTGMTFPCTIDVYREGMLMYGKEASNRKQ